MSDPQIDWIESNSKYTKSLVYGSILFLIMGFITLYFERFDMFFGFIFVSLICFVLYITFRAYINYSFGISNDILYIKKNGKDFLSEKWENIIHDGHMIVIQDFPITVKAYHGDDYGSDTYAKDAYYFGYDQKSIDNLFIKLQNSKKISTQEMLEMKKKNVIDIMTVFIVFILVVIVFGSYIIYVT